MEDMTPQERSDALLALVERVAVALERIAGGGSLKAEQPAADPAPPPVPSAIPECPKCKEPMLLRTAKGSGKQFWVCRKFPACDGARGLDGQTWSGRGGARRSRSDGPQGEGAEDDHDERDEWRDW